MRNFCGESNTVISIVPSDRPEFRSPVIEVLSLLAVIDFTFRKKSRRLRETLHLSVFINAQKAKYSSKQSFIAQIMRSAPRSISICQ